MIDCKVNDWLRSYFPQVQRVPGQGMTSIKSKKDLENMIAGLRHIGSPVALQMAEELSQKGENTGE